MEYLNKKNYLFFILVLSLFILSSSFVFSSTPGDISSCQDLDTPGKYNLIANLESATICFNITSDNVTIEGNSNSINGTADNSYGIFVNSKNFVTNNLNFNNHTCGIYINKTHNVSIIGGAFSDNQIPNSGCTLDFNFCRDSAVNCGLCGGTWLGDVPSAASIWIENSTYVNIDDVGIYNAEYYSINSFVSSNISIYNLTLNGSAIGVDFINNTFFKINSSHFYSTQGRPNYDTYSAIGSLFSKDGEILNNYIWNSSGCTPGTRYGSHGVYVRSSYNISILNNTVVSPDGGGAYIYFSSNINLFNNTLNNTYRFSGIYLSFSENVTLKSNLFYNRINGTAFSLDGNLNKHFSTHDIDNTNIIEDNKVICLNDSLRSYEFSPENVDFCANLICVNCTSINYTGLTLTEQTNRKINLFNTTKSSIFNNTFSGRGYPIYLRSSSFNEIYNNVFSNIGRGFSFVSYLAYSSFCNITNNNVNSAKAGFYSTYSHNLNILNNNFHDLNSQAIYISQSHNFTVKSNILNGSSYAGMGFYQANHGILDNNTFINHSNYGGSSFTDLLNVTLRNNYFKNNRYGIYSAFGADEMLIENNIFEGSTFAEIEFTDSNKLNITNNTFQNSVLRGIYMVDSQNGSIYHNRVHGVEYRGLQLSNARGFKLVGNNVTGNAYNLLVFGDSLEDYDFEIDTNNLIESNKKVFYNYSISDISFDSISDAGMVICAGCDNVTYKNLNLSSNSDECLILPYTNNSIVENVVGSGSEYNFYLDSSHNNKFINCTSRFATRDGMKFRNSFYNEIINSTFEFNHRTGVKLSNADHSNITGSRFFKNRVALSDEASTTGEDVSNNYFEANFYPSNELFTLTQSVSKDQLVQFNFTLKSAIDEACSSCSYELHLYPSFDNLSYHSSGGIVYGNFTPTYEGMYSLIVNVTDLSNNTEKNKYVFLVEESNLTERYYITDERMDNGQLFPQPYRSLEKRQPTEELTKKKYFMAYNVGEYPTYLFGSFKTINFSYFYSPLTTSYGVEMGVERYGRYNTLHEGGTVVPSQIVSGGSGLLYNAFNFSIDWSSDYYNVWNYLVFKTGTTYDSFRINSTYPSVVDITYAYPDSPKIKSLTGEETKVLSAIMSDENSYDSNITIEGNSEEEIQIEMPSNANRLYTPYFDGELCEDSSDCMIQTNALGIIKLKMNLSSIHEIEIKGGDAPTYPSGSGGSSYSNIGHSSTLNPGDSSILNFGGKTSIEQVEIFASERISAPKVSVDFLDKESKLIPSLIEGPVYSYESISSNFDFSKLNKAYIYFKIPKDWLEDNGLDLKEIVLKKYAGEWEDLDTEYVRETDKYVFFKAKTNDFGYFALSEKEINLDNLDLESGEDKVIEEKIVEKEGSNKEVEDNKKTWWVWLVGILIFLVLLFWYFKFKLN